MAATRNYRRQSNGRFAGSGGGVKTTVGKSGGFANAAHRANVANSRASRAHRRALLKRGVKYTASIGGAALAAKVVSNAVNGNTKRSGTKTLADVIKKDIKANPIGDIAQLSRTARRR